MDAKIPISRWPFRCIALVAVAVICLSGPALARAKLVVYSYDSFASWGPAKHIEEGFEKQHDVDLLFVAPSSSGETLARLIGELDAGGTDADVFVGLGDTQLPKALERKLFLRLDYDRIRNLKDVPAELLFDETRSVVPFDHGYVTLVYDVKALAASDVPKSLEELTQPKYARKIIAIDPRTSSVGHAFLMWTIHQYGENGYLDYWERLKPSLLTVAGGWSAAYAMFEKGEAPIVVSYSTDAAYAVMSGEALRYGVITPGGQAYRQIESAGIVRTSRNVDLAYAFLDHLLSPEVQTILPATQVMFPANRQAPLPEEFRRYAVRPQQPVWLAPDAIERNNARWLRAWSELITR